ncbi:hypothetical protein JOC85_001090 [Bacillus mesophilus]|uniref:Zinc chelation protein SecC n=1 Tax=Bacillus mesophilus TaxID=1808955 RepID=A0A6M0Q496_9BACI|nr:SEC-C metal-binding domain-containing protein [Bacillus mesophilus]MBM7660323.1 hypothetical protein [Bacillus mesophilus]NEY71034.1 hypothetical protein [Bacillus mesophilus]
MSNQNSAELKKALKKMLHGLQDMKKEQDEKVHKRHWGVIKIPFTLQEGLGTYTKNELDDIRKKLDVKNVSSLKKAELIEVLEGSIRGNLDDICSLWDSERFNLLLDLAGKDGHINAPNLEVTQIQYLRKSGLIYSGTFEGSRILAVPTDLLEPISALKNNVQVKEKINRNTEWIGLTKGLLYYYGTLDLPLLIEMIEKHTNEKLYLHEYLEVMNDAISYRKDIIITESGFSNPNVSDQQMIMQEQEMRKNLPFYPFTKQQLLSAGEPGFVDQNHTYLKLVSFLMKEFEMSKVEAEGLVGECVIETRMGESPNRILQLMASALKVENVELLKVLTDHVIDLMNHTRAWFLKGHSSMDLKPKETNPASSVSVKVGRNEPCPCDSGKKYKKCCGNVVA